MDFMIHIEISDPLAWPLANQLYEPKMGIVTRQCSVGLDLVM